MTERIPTRDDVEPGEYYEQGAKVYLRVSGDAWNDDLVAEVYAFSDSREDADAERARRIAALLNATEPRWKRLRAILAREFVKECLGGMAYAEDMAQRVALGTLTCRGEDYSDLERQMARELREAYLAWYEEAIR